jgi:hypothetical protein
MILLHCKQDGGGVVPLKGGHMTFLETIALLMLIVAVVDLVVYIFRKKK